MTHNIDVPTATTTELFDQAPNAATVYMNKAIIAIGEQFGEGYAEENPILICEFMRTCAADFNTAMMAKHIAPAIDHIATALMDKTHWLDH